MSDFKSLVSFYIDEIDVGYIIELMLVIEVVGIFKKVFNILVVINRVFGYVLVYRLIRNNFV